MTTIDINADVGESYGAWSTGHDETLVPFLTSANLACGFHGGDPLTMRRTVELAARHGVHIGAHPSFPDLVGFGRRVLHASPEEIEADVLYQIAALDGMVRARGLRLHHVKPHGALSWRMQDDAETARAVARAVSHYSADLPLVVLGGPLGDHLEDSIGGIDVPLVPEGFPDRAYTADGRLAPRRLPNAVIHDPIEVAERAVRMVRDGAIDTIDGGTVRVQIETVCIHGDNPGASEIVQAMRSAMTAEGIGIAPL